MIGNKVLKGLFEYPDQDTRLNQLLELLKFNTIEFLNNLEEPVDLDLCSIEEIEFLTIASALIDYKLQLNHLEVPVWIRNEKLRFDKPYYHSRRLTDFEKFRLQYTNPAPFRLRNVYFDLNGLTRI